MPVLNFYQTPTSQSEFNIRVIYQGTKVISAHSLVGTSTWLMQDQLIVPPTVQTRCPAPCGFPAWPLTSADQAPSSSNRSYSHCDLPEAAQKVYQTVLCSSLKKAVLIMFLQQASKKRLLRAMAVMLTQIQMKGMGWKQEGRKIQFFELCSSCKSLRVFWYACILLLHLAFWSALHNTRKMSKSVLTIPNWHACMQCFSASYNHCVDKVKIVVFVYSQVQCGK